MLYTMNYNISIYKKLNPKLLVQIEDLSCTYKYNRWV